MELLGCSFLDRVLVDPETSKLKMTSYLASAHLVENGATGIGQPSSDIFIYKEVNGRYIVVPVPLQF